VLLGLRANGYARTGFQVRGPYITEVKEGNCVEQAIAAAQYGVRQVIQKCEPARESERTGRAKRLSEFKLV
jgi:hypothetical protein